MHATTDTEMKARILGVASQTETFDFFAVELGRKIFKQNRWQHVKDRNLYNLYPYTLSVLMSLRTDEQFSLFWQYVEKQRSMHK